MIVHVTETTLQSLIGGMKQFRVPLFQRPYTWTERDHLALWNDMVHQYEIVREEGRSAGSGHFIGSFVLAHAPGNAVVPAYLVVDGQQRLTTLTLALCALRDRAAATDPQAHARFTERYLRNLYVEGDLVWKLVPTRQDQAAYFACVEGRPPDDGSLIAEAYQFFRVKLAEIDTDEDPLDVQLLETVIVSRLAIVDITAQAGDNVHRIFESLNARGVGLTQADLLRNHLFMLLPTRGEHVYETVWRPMQELLGAENLVGLARVDLRRRGQDVRDDDVYRVQQERLATLAQDEPSIEAEVRDLALRARHYHCIVDPANEARPEVRRLLLFQNRWQATTAHPVVMHLYGEHHEGRLDDAAIVEALRLVESFLVRRLIVGTPSNSLSRIFLQLVIHLRDIPERPAVDGIRIFLSGERRSFPTDGELRTAIRQRPFYLHGRASQRRLVLERLEESFEHKEQGDLSSLSLSVEHVLPQTLTPEWSAAVSEGEPAEVIHRDLVHTLGNLTLTAYNSELSNDPFERKQQIYGESLLSLNRGLLDTPRWGRAEIEARAARLANRAIAIWPGPVDGAPGTSSGVDWSRVRAAVAALPRGRWTAYADLAALAGTGAQAVGNHIAAHPAIPGTWRVLNADGAVSSGFRWADPDDSRDPQKVLEGEGIPFDATERADNTCRLRRDDLLALVNRYDGDLDDQT